MNISIQNEKGYSKIQRLVWRWHFYAGLMVIPFALILAISGTIYLYKPQYEAYIENNINSKVVQGDNVALPAEVIIDKALHSFVNPMVKKYFIAKENDPTIEIELLSQGVSYWVVVNKFDGSVLEKSILNDKLMHWVKGLHGELLAGNQGSYVVELMASWMIVLILSGLYLWWPRNETNIGVMSNLKTGLFFTSKGLTTREKWRKWHGTLGIWFSLLILIFLVTGLPWTQLWGAGFKDFQKMIDLKSPGQEWKITLSSTAPKSTNILWDTNEKTDEAPLQATKYNGLQQLVDKLSNESLAEPVHIQPPKNENGVWTVRSMAQYRPDRQTIHYDKYNYEELLRIKFEDHNTLQQVVSVGIAFHEGALFGVLNQVLATIIALVIVVLAVSGFTMWRKRKPTARLGAPRKPRDILITPTVMLLTGFSIVFLPMVAISVFVIVVIDFIFINTYKKLKDKLA